VRYTIAEECGIDLRADFLYFGYVDAMLDPFGLVGSGRCPSVRKVSVYHLPDEILEAVLYRLPFLDLMGCITVCKRWKDIISNSRVRPYNVCTYLSVQFS